MDISQKILSDVIVYMKYARYIPELERRESWEEIINRNMMMHINKFPNLVDEISKNYQIVYDKKVLPSMRGLQFGGKAIEINPARQYNCSALAIDDPFAFAEVMFLLLSGCGCGWSVQRHHIEKLPTIKRPIDRSRRHLIQDSIEGWADSIKILMKSYFYGLSDPEFDFSSIRPKGTILKTSGGKAPGPQPLKDCLHKIRGILDSKNSNTKLTSLECHDILCFISDAVLSGGIRRSSAISLFSYGDEEMLHCKYGNWWEQNPQRGRSNNSVVLLRHKIKKNEFVNIWDKIENSRSGEPGFIFSNNSEYLFNPCGEISLRSNQFCNLVEVNVSDIESQEDFIQRARIASFIATLQASYTNFHYIRDTWRINTEKDALIGVGLTGIASGEIFKYDIKKAAEIIKEENKRVAKIIGINPAARTTCVKPSGTSSLVLGCSSGIHAWHSSYYLRRVRVLKNEPIYNYLKVKIPEMVEDDYFNPTNQAVITFPIKAPKDSIYRTETAIDLLERVKLIYDEWIVSGHTKGDNTNNVSCTVTIKDNEWKEVGEWMWKNRDHYNGLSVLPEDCGSYKQAPLEECSKYIYDKLIEHCKDIDLTQINEKEDNTELKENVACAGGGCEIS